MYRQLLDVKRNDNSRIDCCSHSLIHNLTATHLIYDALRSKWAAGMSSTINDDDAATAAADAEIGADVDADDGGNCVAVAVVKSITHGHRIYHVSHDFDANVTPPTTKLLDSSDDDDDDDDDGGGDAVSAATTSSSSSCVPSNWLRGVKYSPDGLCLLTNSEDGVLRVFEPPRDISSSPSPSSSSSSSSSTSLSSSSSTSSSLSLSATLHAPLGGVVFDAVWHPLMLSNADSQAAGTAVFAATGRDRPIQLFDAFTGQLRATYAAFSAMDEPVSALSLAFSARGDRLFAGYNGSVRVFDTAQPGRTSSLLNVAADDDACRFVHRSNINERGIGRAVKKARVTAARDGFGRRHAGVSAHHTTQPGIVSAVAVSPIDDDFFAVGSYAGNVHLYSTNTGRRALTLADSDADTGRNGSSGGGGGGGGCGGGGGGSGLLPHRGGVTHLRWSPNGGVLYTAGRRTGDILCWDVRQTARVLARFPRRCRSNQRLFFDVDAVQGRWLATGSECGDVLIYDVTQPMTSQATGQTAAAAVADSINSPPMSINSAAAAAAVVPNDDGLLRAAPACVLRAAHSGDVVNGVSFHPWFDMRTPFLATCSGARRIGCGIDSDDDDDVVAPVDNSVSVWNLQAATVATPTDD
jgi:WD40 repeat protein